MGVYCTIAKELALKVNGGICAGELTVSGDGMSLEAPYGVTIIRPCPCAEIRGRRVKNDGKSPAIVKCEPVDG